MREINFGEVLISQEQIQERVLQLGQQITEDFRGEPVLMVGILKGSFLFMADLVRAVDLDITVDFMCVSSYGSGTTTSGNVKIIKDLDGSIEGKNVIIVEDIVDSGLTLMNLTKMLLERNPKKIVVCTALDKPSRRKVDFHPDYIGFEVEDKFIVGYGLDADQRFRQLPYISWQKEE